MENTSYRWLVWLTMLVIGALLIVVGFNGRPGSLLGAVFTPSALETGLDTSTTAQTQSSASNATSASPPIVLQ